MSTRGKTCWQGMNWISQHKRLAIYMRDGFSCVWCGSTLESGITLSLDHVVCHCKTANNDETNLVTCCKSCNDSRGARTANKFAVAVAMYINHGVKAEAILANVHRARRRVLAKFLDDAKAAIALRGSCFNVLKGRK